MVVLFDFSVCATSAVRGQIRLDQTAVECQAEWLRVRQSMERLS